MVSRRDFYDALGVSRDATAEEIQREYRKLARTYHPDVNKDPDAEQRFAEISEAYDVLSDPDTRTRYDTFGPDFRQVPDGVDPASWRRTQAAGRRPAGARSRAAGGPGPTWYTASGSSDDDIGIDIDDLLGGMFGGGGGRRRRGWGPIAGADQEVELELTVEEAYVGGRRGFTLQGPDGDRQLEVTIPAGVVDGQRIRLSGQGGQGTEGARSGDLYFVVRLLPHSRYRVGRSEHQRLAAVGPVGGGARRVRRHRYAGRRSQGPSARRIVDRPAAPAQGTRDAQPQGHTWGSVRGGGDRGAPGRDRRGASPLRGAVSRV